MLPGPLPHSAVDPGLPFVTCLLTEALLDAFDIPGWIQSHLSFSFPNFISGCLDNVSIFLPVLDLLDQDLLGMGAIGMGAIPPL